MENVKGRKQENKQANPHRPCSVSEQTPFWCQQIPIRNAEIMDNDAPSWSCTYRWTGNVLVGLGHSMSICGSAQHFYVQSLHTQFEVQEMFWEGPAKRSGWQRQEFTAFSGKVHHNHEDMPT